MNKSKQSWFVAVLCCAIFFVSLLPSLKTIAAKPAVGQLLWEVCSVTPGQEKRANAPSPSHHEHCPYCTAHGPGLIALPATPILLALIKHSVTNTFPTLPSNIAENVWIAPPSRAPPSL